MARPVAEDGVMKTDGVKSFFSEGVLWKQNLIDNIGWYSNKALHISNLSYPKSSIILRLSPSKTALVTVCRFFCWIGAVCNCTSSWLWW